MADGGPVALGQRQPAAKLREHRMFRRGLLQEAACRVDGTPVQSQSDAAQPALPRHPEPAEQRPRRLRRAVRAGGDSRPAQVGLSGRRGRYATSALSLDSQVGRAGVEAAAERPEKKVLEAQIRGRGQCAELRPQLRLPRLQRVEIDQITPG